MKVEEITPYGDPAESKTGQVRHMFDNIAPAYDTLNRAMTLGMDRLWRRKAVSLLSPASAYPKVLDVATGTADIAIRLARANATPSITGIDLSEGMLAIGRRKVAEAKLPPEVKIELRQADCLHSGLADGEFDGVICAYGVRNFADIRAGLREMHRITRPGGALVILELSTPASPLVRPFYNFYTHRVIPLMGRFVSGDSNAYTYLPQSVAAVPQGSRMTDLILEAGYREARAISLCMGVSTIYHATK